MTVSQESIETRAGRGRHASAAKQGQAQQSLYCGTDRSVTTVRCALVRRVDSSTRCAALCSAVAAQRHAEASEAS